jgi:hypothetical protein
MKLWVWIVIGVGAGILTLGFVTGFWQHLFTPSYPNPAFRIGSNDTMIPTAKGQTETTAEIKQVSVFCMPVRLPNLVWYNWCVW